MKRGPGGGTLLARELVEWASSPIWPPRATNMGPGADVLALQALRQLSARLPHEVSFSLSPSDALEGLQAP